MIHLIAKPPKRKKEQRQLDAVLRRFDERGAEYILHTTKNAGDATEFAKKLCEEDGAFLVAIGGDGMLNEVISGIDPERCTLGLIPAGTGNDFATVTKIPFGVKAVDFILDSEPKLTDYLQFADGKRSINIAGVGIDVDILERCYRMKRLHAKIKYFLSLLLSLMKYKGIDVEIETDGGKEQKKVLIAAVCNGRTLGGGIPLCPPAEVDDGKLNLVVVDFPKRRKIPGALLKLMGGKLFKVSFAKFSVWENASIRPLSPCTAQYDGELSETAELRAELVTGKLKMYRG